MPFAAMSPVMPAPMIRKSVFTCIRRPAVLRSGRRTRTRMREQDLTRIVVTRSDGTLNGVLRREDLERQSSSEES
jgi:hypothetical protein